MNSYQTMRRRRALQTTLLLTLAMIVLPCRADLSLQAAIERAQANDPWIAGSLLRESVLRAKATAAGSLPDPMVNLGFANLPTDTFDFDQEAMTQFKVGVSQTFPRGDTRALQQRQLELRGEEHPYQRSDRLARVAASVTELWLEGYRASAAIDLIERDRGLFEQLVAVAESNYSSALGRTRQQDLIRAQLELTRLDDRLTVLRERLDTSRTRLSEWLYTPTSAGVPDRGEDVFGSTSMTKPVIDPRNADLLNTTRQMTADELASILRQHPAVLAVDQRIVATAAGIEIAEQGYRPQWRLDASYGYRDDDPVAGDRADFFSVGVAFDLPLWTERRQDQNVRSASAATEAVRTERALLLRQLLGNVETARARLAVLDQRQALYRDRLLREMSDQAEASLAAYTNDDGDFAEVVRARIAEINARIEALDIEVDRLLTINQLNYLATGEGRS